MNNSEKEKEKERSDRKYAQEERRRKCQNIEQKRKL